MPEFRRDPITGRWVIISTERGRRPADFGPPPDRKRGGFCPFCPGNEEKTPGEIFALAASIGIAKFVAMVLLQLWQPLKFLLVPGFIQSARTRTRALVCFKVGAERRTQVRTGILIYVSMREHRAEIVADETIAARVSDTAWEEAMGAMLGHIREGRVADGLIAAVDKVGAVLALHCPRADDDRNELPDRLIEV